MIRLLIADDHAIVRSGLKQIFAHIPDFEVIGEASNSNEVMEHVGRDALDVLLLDLDMPGTSGTDLIERVKHRCPDLPILVLSMHNEPGIAMRAIKAGASGYITKNCDLNVLLPAIRKLAAGGTYIDPVMAQRMLFDETPAAQTRRHGSLTDREMQVLNLLVGGTGVNEIAIELGISNKTVSTHKVRLMEKLEVNSMADLVRYAMQHELMG